jgi:hypothetical protein
MLNRKIVTLALLLTTVLFTGVGFSQIKIEQDTVGNAVLLSREHSFYGMLHSNGWGFGFRKSLDEEFYKKRMFEAEFLEMRSPKEIKTTNPYYSDAGPFYFGKLNACYIIRSGIGYQNLMNQKPYWGGIEVRYFYYAGAEVALAKPVYLRIIESVTTGGITNYTLITERYDPVNHPVDIQDIYGKASFFKGINQIKPYPGLYGKFGFNFEYGKYNTKVVALEAGVIVDYHPKAVPIMAFNKNPNLITTAYISFHFGKRYN